MIRIEPIIFIIIWSIQITVLLTNLPARESICRFLISQRYWSPKSLNCEHQRRYSADKDLMVTRWPTPISVTCTHLKLRTNLLINYDDSNLTVKVRGCGYIRPLIIRNFLKAFLYVNIGVLLLLRLLYTRSKDA